MPFKLKRFYSPTKQRAFKFLVNELGISQKQSQRDIANGRLFIDGKAMTKPTAEVEGHFEFVVYEPSTRGLKPIRVEDKFVVFDKPSGVLIHPQNRNTEYSLVDELKYQFGLDANIAHRIDQETSGLVLCAKDKQSEKDIKSMFEFRDMNKTYLALVHGNFENEITIDEPLLRREDESAIVRMVVKVHKDGKASKTYFNPLEYFPKANMTLVECKPYTGRQHQIRVHLFHVKHPIVGDPIYGQKEEDVLKFLDKKIFEHERIKLSGASRLMLHASELEFDLYNKNYKISSKEDFLNEVYKVVK
ncbi:RluA family pseudouridine synthase [Sulfurimonas lithotrophica]|uniref:RNA pseudouridylate synthase n=1 Tax=Sulfurimonas lithotrophica TaxID=2590022 RepID=A0A5P8NXP7_9BACT|nr:RluA family pseudouridine synthase [Sulfurimonas lithotrophica]QFR48201.1 RluA family pseudouridine synthase [Sulfurimonas lithotrophica]